MPKEPPKREVVGPASLIGTVLSRKWHIDRLLGSGGMSSVYEATHRNGKRVAIKVLSPELSTSERFRRRFLREGYIANRVGHPGAVSVLDDDEVGALVFLVMELLEGRNLEELRAKLNGTLPAHEVAAVALELLAVLAAAHANGIVHRDIKPGNVFLTLRREIKLLDFGIASLREIPGVATQTETGATLGTPGFMAPEQARGRWAELTPATDVWAVGATMFRLLSGRLVHEEETPSETMIAVATRPARSLSTVCSELPPALVAVVDRALCIDPSERFASADAMAEALRLAGQDLPALELPVLTEDASIAHASARTRDEGSLVSADAGTFGSLTVTGDRQWPLFSGRSKSARNRYGLFALLAAALVVVVVAWFVEERRAASGDVASSARGPAKPPHDGSFEASAHAFSGAPREAPAPYEAHALPSPSGAPSATGRASPGVAPPARAPGAVQRRAPVRPSASTTPSAEELLRERL